MTIFNLKKNGSGGIFMAYSACNILSEHVSGFVIMLHFQIFVRFVFYVYVYVLLKLKGMASTHLCTRTAISFFFEPQLC